MKHPGPWMRDEYGDVWDASGHRMFKVRFVSCVEHDDLLPLILAAPELLEALKETAVRCEELFHVGKADDTTDECKRASALIARIEGGIDRPPPWEATRTVYVQARDGDSAIEDAGESVTQLTTSNPADYVPEPGLYVYAVTLTASKVGSK